MAVDGPYAEFAHPPGFVAQGLDDLNACSLNRFVVAVDAVDFKISEIGMIAEGAGGRCIGAFSGHDAGGALDVKTPAGIADLHNAEAEPVAIEGKRGFQIGYGDYMADGGNRHRRLHETFQACPFAASKASGCSATGGGAICARMTAPPKIFDRRLYARRRARAARTFAGFDFLHRRVMEDIVDRLETVTRDFPRAVFAGAGDLTGMLTPACGVGAVIAMDLAPERLPAGGARLAADEEALPFAPESVDLFVSVLTLHTSNDLVGALAQARMALKPDGLFIAAVFGEETLGSLRRALYAAEAEIAGGVSPRIAPFAAIQDYGQALARAGFALPVVDIDKVSVRYKEPMSLLRDLRGMGETGALANRAAPLRRETLMRAMTLFADAGGAEKFEIVYLTGWAPHERQQKPLKPGSAATPLKDAIKGAS